MNVFEVIKDAIIPSMDEKIPPLQLEHHEIDLTSPEMTALWTTYIQNTATLCYLPTLFNTYERY